MRAVMVVAPRVISFAGSMLTVAVPAHPELEAPVIYRHLGLRVISRKHLRHMPYAQSESSIDGDGFERTPCRECS